MRLQPQHCRCNLRRGVGGVAQCRTSPNVTDAAAAARVCRSKQPKRGRVNFQCSTYLPAMGWTQVCGGWCRSGGGWAGNRGRLVLVHMIGRRGPLSGRRGGRARALGARWRCTHAPSTEPHGGSPPSYTLHPPPSPCPPLPPRHRLAGDKVAGATPSSGQRVPASRLPGGENTVMLA